MEQSNKVSVIILTYGDFSGLNRTIESVLTQEYPIHTLIISDDGSGCPFPDLIKKKLSQSQEQYQKLIIRSNLKNLGTVAHMNLTSALCESEYLKFMAAGDAFSSKLALGELLFFAQQHHNALVVTSNVAICSRDLSKRLYVFPGRRRGRCLNQKPEVVFESLCKANIISAVGTLYRQSFFSEEKGLDESYRLMEDWPTWLKLTRSGNSIPFLENVTCFYAVGGISSEYGDALSSDKLRGDMIHCYQKEIIPYIDDFSSKTKSHIYYCWARLQRRAKKELWRQYFVLELRTTIKRSIKWILLKISAINQESAS